MSSCCFPAHRSLAASCYSLRVVCVDLLWLILVCGGLCRTRKARKEQRTLMLCSSFNRSASDRCLVRLCTCRFYQAVTANMMPSRWLAPETIITFPAVVRARIERLRSSS